MMRTGEGAISTRSRTAVTEEAVTQEAAEIRVRVHSGIVVGAMEAEVEGVAAAAGEDRLHSRISKTVGVARRLRCVAL